MLKGEGFVCRHYRQKQLGDLDQVKYPQIIGQVDKIHRCAGPIGASPQCRMHLQSHLNASEKLAEILFLKISLLLGQGKMNSS